MLSDELKTIIAKIEQQGKMHFLDKATEEQISAFECKHGVDFPSQYKEWLQFSDGGELFLPAGIQLYGVAHKPLIDINDNDRPNENYIVIGALASGDPILCQKSGDAIAIYNREASRIELDEVYQDYYAFLSDLPEMLGFGG